MKIYNVADVIEVYENESDLIQLNGHLDGDSENPEIRKPAKTSKPVHVLGFDRSNRLKLMQRTMNHGFNLFFRSSSDRTETFFLEIPYTSWITVIMCGGGGGLRYPGGDTICIINGNTQVAGGGLIGDKPLGGGFSIDSGKDPKVVQSSNPDKPGPGIFSKFMGNKWFGHATTGGGGSKDSGGGCGQFVDFEFLNRKSGGMSFGGFIGGIGEREKQPAIGFGGGRIQAGGGAFVFLSCEVNNRTNVITGSVPGHNNKDSSGGAICIWF
jgi:hypothetical protein